MADVALVGFPNSGKSTLISRVSAAKPKIADYPFTTLEPHLGVVRFDEHEFVLADIPGLIEGASEGKGLGHRFLRHIERARALVVLVDLAPMDGRSPEAQEGILLDELRRYQPELTARPRVVVGSKADVADPALEWTGARVSAVTGDGLRPLLGDDGRTGRAGAGGAAPSAPVRGAPARARRRGCRARYRRVVGRAGPERGAGRGPVRPHYPRGAGLRPGSVTRPRRRPGAGPGRGAVRRPGPHRRLRIRVRTRRGAGGRGR